MNKICFCIFILFMQGWTSCLDNKIYFSCSSEKVCNALFFSGCYEDWKLDSIIIRSLDMREIWQYKEPQNEVIGTSLGVVEINLRRKQFVFLEVCSNYGIWVKKMEVDDPYENQSQFVPDE